MARHRRRQAQALSPRVQRVFFGRLNKLAPVITKPTPSDGEVTSTPPISLSRSASVFVGGAVTTTPPAAISFANGDGTAFAAAGLGAGGGFGGFADGEAPRVMRDRSHSSFTQSTLVAA
jgi:hypothetical protein